VLRARRAAGRHAGGLTALGPLLGGYLTSWTWRAIFRVNVPVAVIAIVLTVLAKPVTAKAPARLDVRGAVLVGIGVALSVFGFQQSEQWGWHNPATGAYIAGGLVFLAVFVVIERRTSSPLINLRMFTDRTFLRPELRAARGDDDLRALRDVRHHGRRRADRVDRAAPGRDRGPAGR
jgi:MFS family permease